MNFSKKIKPLSQLLALSSLILTVTNCSSKLSSEKIASQLQQSIVRVSDENQKTYGTGFFVPGKSGVCTVLTAAQVVNKNNKQLLQTHDKKLWNVISTKIFSNNIDLAIVTFQPEGKKCNYQTLKIGNSDNLKTGNSIYIYGFSVRSEKFAPQFVWGTVSGWDKFVQSYRISYEASTVDGMIGAPVVNVRGEVVAVHGISDMEILQGLVSIKKSLPDRQWSSFEQVFGKFSPDFQQAIERVEADTRLQTFQWGVPINLFQEYRERAFFKNVPLVSEVGVDYTKLHNFLAAGKWKDADYETARLVPILAGEERRFYLRKKDLYNLPCKDLETINKLWLKYSKGKFGFSIQRKIYQNLGGSWYLWKIYRLAGATNKYHERVLKTFVEKVGWWKRGKWNLVWSDVNPNTSYIGHLPWGALVGDAESPKLTQRMELFLSRIDSCGI